MIECRQGFDEAAATVMESVQSDQAPQHIQRCRDGLFWAIYHDGKPCGGILIERNCIHVSSLRPCGHAVRRVVREYLKTHPVLFAPIRPANERAQRLAKGLGFAFWQQMDGFNVYRRYSNEHLIPRH